MISMFPFASCNWEVTMQWLHLWSWVTMRMALGVEACCSPQQRPQVALPTVRAVLLLQLSRRAATYLIPPRQP